MSSNEITPEAMAERQRCIALINEWLAAFGDEEIKYTSARDWASGAMLDLIDAIESGEQCQTQTQVTR